MAERVRIKLERLDNKQISKPVPVAEDSKENYRQIIYVGEDWRLCYDDLQYIVQQRKVRQGGDKKGQSYWCNEAYIRSINNALIWLARRKVYSVPGIYDCDAIDVLTERLDKIEADIRDAINKHIEQYQKAQKEKL